MDHHNKNKILILVAGIVTIFIFLIVSFNLAFEEKDKFCYIEYNLNETKSTLPRREQVYMHLFAPVNKSQIVNYTCSDSFDKLPKPIYSNDWIYNVTNTDWDANDKISTIGYTKIKKGCFIWFMEYDISMNTTTRIIQKNIYESKFSEKLNDYDKAINKIRRCE